MVTKELLDYIKSQKIKGIDDEKIEADLIENNWECEDIREALDKVNRLDPSTPFEIQVKDRDNVFVIDETTSHPATQADEHISTPIGDKPKVIAGVISILLIVISFLFIYRAGIMITIMSIVDYYSHTAGAIHYFLNEFPLYGWVVISFALSACVMLYASFKVRSSSKPAFWFSFFSLLLLPASLSYINYKLMYSVARYFSKDAIILMQDKPNIPAGTSTLIVGVLGEPAFIISLITLVILLISYKKFHLPKESMPSNLKKIFITLTVLFFIPTLLFVYMSYSKAQKDDFGYKMAQEKVTYHIYKPNPIPLGMVYAADFLTDREMVGESNAVQVVYDFAYQESPDISKSRPITLKQTGVSQNFSIADYLAKESGVYSEQVTVNVNTSKDRTGYLIKNSLSDGGHTKNLIYVTQDDVLISLSTVDSGDFDLIDLANSLK
ncbi:hypothetical protein K0B04_04255 [Patescibacteria group bacterium]|nr:hypothetical protein [Patescibacteria group bacterium]